jgi:hypothetical protein
MVAARAVAVSFAVPGRDDAIRPPLRRHRSLRDARQSEAIPLEEISMKTDMYTKVILTVIAVCLALIAFQKSSLIPEAHAQQQVHVYIDGASSYALQFAGPLQVRQ